MPSFGTVQLPDINPLAAFYASEEGDNTVTQQRLSNTLAANTLGANTQTAANVAESGSLANQLAAQKNPLEITGMRQQLGIDPSPTLDRLRDLYNGGNGQPAAPPDGSAGPAPAGQSLLTGPTPVSADSQTQADVGAEAKAQGVNPAWAMRVHYVESGASKTPFGPGSTSPKGNVGPMQLGGPTADDLEVNRYDYADNIHGGVKYLAQLKTKYDSPVLATAAYNAGPGRVDAFLAGEAGLPPETIAYVGKVFGSNGAGLLNAALTGAHGHAIPGAAVAANQNSAPAQPPAQPGMTVAPDPSAPASAPGVQTASRGPVPGAPVSDVGSGAGMAPASAAPAPPAQSPGGTLGSPGTDSLPDVMARLRAAQRGGAAPGVGSAQAVQGNAGAPGDGSAVAGGQPRTARYLQPSEPGYVPGGGAQTTLSPADWAAYYPSLKAGGGASPAPGQAIQGIAGADPVANPNSLLGYGAAGASAPPPGALPAPPQAAPVPAAQGGQPPSGVQPPAPQPASVQPGTGMNAPQVQQAQDLLRRATQIEMAAAATPNDPRAKATAAAMAADLRGRAAVLMQADSVTVGPDGLQTHTLTGKVDSAATPAMNYKPDPNNPGVLVSPGQKPVVLPPGRPFQVEGQGAYVVGPGGVVTQAVKPDLPAVAGQKAAEAQGSGTGSQAVTQASDLIKMGRAADTAIGNIDYGLNQLAQANKAGLPSGYYSPGVASAASALKYFGLNLPGVKPEAVADLQTAQKTLAVVGGAILQNTIGKDSQITDGKISAFIHTQPNIELDPQAIPRILNWARSQFVYEREMSMSGMNVASKNNGMLPLGWQAGYYSGKGSFAPIYDPLSGEMKQPDGQAPSRQPPGEASAAPSPAQPASAPIPPPADRVPNHAYATPRGLMTWTGTGWLPAQAR